MRKRIIALILALLIICSSCIAMLFASASDKTVDANIVMFENVLENKKWIVESLVDGNFNNNPFTLAIPYADETSLMTEVLTNYKDNTAFKYLVDGMELYKNSDEYIQAGVGELIEMFGNFISNMTDDQLVTFVDSSIKSVAELKYESILNDIFMTDYKSSWNSTLFESNATMEEYRQRAKLLKSLSGYQKALSTGNELLTGDEFFDTKENFTEYVDKFISAYSDNLYTFLTTTPNLSAYKKTLTENEAMTKYITNTAALAFVSFAELKTPRFSSQASGIVSEIFCEYLAPLTSSALKSAGKVINFGSKVTKYAMLLEALINQNSGTIKSLNRIKNVTSDEDLTKVIDYYTELVKNQSDKDAIAGEFFIDYLANKGIVGKYATKGVWALYDELSKVKKSCFDADLNVLSSATSEKLVSLGKCVSIGVWLADKATSIVDTSKEIYVCKYTEKILKEAIAAYKADYKAYCKQKTDENAEKCIDDLELLKKLRLYGEKHAYSSMSSQTDSVVGILMGGGDVSGYLKEKYQAQVDALLGCAILPQEATEFTVGKKEELIFMPDVLSNGTVTLEAIYKKSDKSTVVIPEADTIFMSKLTLNGGTLKILSTSGYDFPVFLTSLVTKGEANIEIYNSSFAVGAFNNSGTLNMKLVNPTSSFTVTGSATNSDKLTVEGAGSEIKMYSFSNTGTVNAGDATLNISGTLSNSGTITSNVIITADGTKDCFNDSYSEIPSPSVSGNGDISNLTFSSRYKKGIKINGEQRISGYLSTGKTRLRTPENLVITGACVIDGGVLNSGITFRNYTSNSPLVINGTVYIENNVTFNKNVKFNGGLHLTSKCETLTLNGALEVKGDVEYKAGTISGTDWLKLHSDLNITAPQPNIAKLEFIGKVPQTIKSSSTLNVTQLSNNNTSVQGVTFNSAVYVSGLLSSDSTSAYNNGKNIFLTGNAKLNGGYIKGNISAEDWSMSDSMTVKGSFFTSGAITIGEGLTLKAVGYRQSDGSLTMNKGSSLNCSSFINYGQLTKAEESSIDCKEEFYLGGTGTDKSSITVGGDCILKSGFEGGTLTCSADISSADLSVDKLTFKSKVPQVFDSSGTVSVNTVTVNNSASSEIGVTFNSPITVSEAFICEKGSTYSNGKNIIMTGNAVINKDTVKGDISAKGWAIAESLTVRGSIFTSGAIVLGDDVALNVIKYQQSDGSLTMNKGSSLKCSSFTNKGSLSAAEETAINCEESFSLNGEGTGKLVLTVSEDCVFKSSFSGKSVFCRGDLSATTLTAESLTFDSKTPQSIKASAAVTTDNLTVNNTSDSGLTVECDITVNKDIKTNNSNIVNSSRIKLAGDDIGVGGKYNDMALDGTLTVDSDTEINGYLTLSSKSELVINENVTLTVARFVKSSSSKITVGKGAKLIIGEYFTSSSDTLTVNGEMTINGDTSITSSVVDSPGTVMFKGDAKISSSTVSASGLLTFLGDLTVSAGTWKNPNLSFLGKVPQVIEGSAINVGDLEINNRCNTGIKFYSRLTYSGELKKLSSTITGENNIIAKS